MCRDVCVPLPNTKKFIINHPLNLFSYLLTYSALQPLCGLGLPQECPKPPTVSRLRLPVRYPGLKNSTKIKIIKQCILTIEFHPKFDQYQTKQLLI